VPFDASINAEGNSNMEVAQSLHRSISSALQSSKSTSMVDEFQQFEKEKGFDYVHVDFFSRKEHFLLCTLWFLITLILFTLLYTLGCFVYYQFHPQGLNPIDAEVLKHELLMASYVKAALFLLFWNILYFRTYPRFLKFWTQVILESPSFHSWYERFIMGPLGLRTLETTQGEDGSHEAQ